MHINLDKKKEEEEEEEEEEECVFDSFYLS
jgi:hypothetical protein